MKDWCSLCIAFCPSFCLLDILTGEMWGTLKWKPSKILQTGPLTVSKKAANVIILIFCGIWQTLSICFTKMKLLRIKILKQQVIWFLVYLFKIRCFFSYSNKSNGTFHLVASLQCHVVHVKPTLRLNIISIYFTQIKWHNMNILCITKWKCEQFIQMPLTEMLWATVESCSVSV